MKNLFINGPLKGDAEEQAIVLRDEIKSYYHEDSGRDKIMQQLELYFEDPALICSFGRLGLSEDVLKQHEGPAEVKSLFKKYKHHYGDHDKVHL